MMNNKKKIALWVVSISAVLLAILICVGNYMVDFALRPDEHGRLTDLERDRAESKYPGILSWYDSLRTVGAMRDTTMTGQKGELLHGVIISTPHARGTAIVIHGYTDSHFTFINLAGMYREDLGFNVLMPELHYHGQSEGTHVRMGWLDRLDIKNWVNMASSIWPDDKIVIHGVSMGAATTMMTSGESDLNPAVVAFVEDCGYTSVWDQFKYELKLMFGLPAFPVMHVANLICKVRYGWSFREASSVKQLEKCTKPMLFIHGDKDDYVPSDDIYDNYAAKTQGVKEIWVARDTDHANAYRNHPAEYTDVVRNFLNNNGFRQ